MPEILADFSAFKPYNLQMHGVRLPEFTIPQEELDKLGLSRDNCSNFDFLRKLCLEGFKKLNLKKNTPLHSEYAERVKKELDTLKDLGFVDYILLVWLVMNFCNRRGIPVGLGRGSAAGSLVLFLIGVTKIDPIKYDLYFERFISKTRAKKKVVDGVTYLDGSLMCDVDMDICYYRRHEVLEFLDTTFSGKTAKILTLNTLSGKLLIKECGKVVGNKSETEMVEVAGMIPKVFGKVKDIDEAYEEVAEFKAWCDDNKEIYSTALKLRDLIKNKGVHPSGILLSYGQLQDSCPVELSSDKNIVSGFDMEWVSLLNVKLDCLGLRSVSVVDDICKSIGLKMDEIDLTDPTIYQPLQDLKSPHGLFQIEADTGFKATQKIKPKNLEELSGVLAIARPGAMEFLDKYANFTNTGTTETVHPFFDDVFGKTGNLCLYQEQLLSALKKIGFSAEEAEIARRIVGKKKVEEMKEWKQKIADKVAENKLDPSISDVVWGIAEASANYSFNKCLSLDTVVETENGDKLISQINIGDKVLSYDVDNDKDHFVEVANIHSNNVELFEVELEDGRVITCSLDHKLLCEDKKMRPLKEILLLNCGVLCNN